MYRDVRILRTDMDMVEKAAWAVSVCEQAWIFAIKISHELQIQHYPNRDTY
jgi:hypothetical protein